MQNETCNSPFYHKKLLMDGPSAPKICPVQGGWQGRHTFVNRCCRADIQQRHKHPYRITGPGFHTGFSSPLPPFSPQSEIRQAKPTHTPGQLHLYRPGREGLIRPFSFSAPAPGAPARRAGPERPPTPSPCPRWQAPQPAEDRSARGQRAKSQCK